MTDRVAIYARASTDSQSTAPQVSALISYCSSRGWLEPEIFSDDGVSGVRDNRPELDKLRARVLRGELQVVVVQKMDRLGRSLGMILRFWDELESAGTRVVVVDQAIDTSTAAGRLQRNMLAALAEFERELILERTRAGIQRARNLRKKFGRPRTVTDAQRVSILELHRGGAPARGIARTLKMKESTVRTIIRRESASVQSPPRISAGLPTSVGS